MRAILVMSMLLGCTSTSTCKQGTVFIHVTYQGATANADTVTVIATVDGGSPVATMLQHTAGNGGGTIEVQFPSGYPRGHMFAVEIHAFSGDQLVGVGMGSVNLTGGCEPLDVAIAAGQLDLSVPDLESVEFGGIDLSVTDESTNDLSGDDLSQRQQVDLAVPIFVPDLSTIADLGECNGDAGFKACIDHCIPLSACCGTSDCPVGQACDLTTNTCTADCGPTQPCNGTCCNGATCAASITQSTCGAAGGSCSDCTMSSAGTACEANGACGCDTQTDCPTQMACNTVNHLCETTCGDANHTICHGGCCSVLTNTCLVGTAHDACGKNGMACTACAANAICNGSQVCQCLPACSGKSCGPNGCGGTCGTCAAGTSCTGAGTCCGNLNHACLSSANCCGALTCVSAKCQ